MYTWSTLRELDLCWPCVDGERAADGRVRNEQKDEEDEDLDVPAPGRPCSQEHQYCNHSGYV